jgi:hypothetical protein
MFFPVRKIFGVLVAVTISLLAIYTFNTLSIHFLPENLPVFFITMFHLDAEANVPTWYQTVLSFSVSLTSFLIFYLYTTRLRSGRVHRLFWFFFLIAFCFISLDEAAMVHEAIGTATSIKWVYIYAPASALFFVYCVVYWVFIRKEDRTLRFWIIAGLLVYAAGGLLCEWINYKFFLVYALHQVEYVLEEGFEMLGLIMILMGCLRELNNQFEKAFKVPF